MLSIVLILLASLYFHGIIIRVKAMASGRRGAGVFQPIKDVIRLFNKGSVYSETSSYIFQIAPTIYFASIISVALLIPFGQYEGVFSFEGDFVVFAYTLAFGKFFLIINSLDVGSPFEGMGAAREVLYSMFVEPAYFILLGSYAMLSGYTSFAAIFSHLHFAGSTEFVFYLMAFISAYVLFQIMMIENSRMPLDDPKTHLELTMIHEVSVLDNSGYDLGQILQGANLKFAIYGALIANLLIPPSLDLWISIPCFFILQFILAVIAGLAESFRARLPMKENPRFILTLTSISIIVFFGVLILTNKFNF